MRNAASSAPPAPSRATASERPSGGEKEPGGEGRGGGGKGRLQRLIGWQGFTVDVPEDWDLTGFSGTDESGYLRIDDGAEQGLEVKWATAPKKMKTPPDVTVRRESYFRALRQTARKKRIDLETKEVDAPRPVLRPDRAAAGFTWTGDRKAIGAVWYCQTCRRTVIAQVLGARSGKGGLSGIAAEVLGTLRCHNDDAEWRTWALYDLVTEVPAEYKLVSQQLMNVYLRLQFAKGTARLTVEQWSLASMARRDSYLDVWLQANSRGDVREARFMTDEGETHGHPALKLVGGPALGRPMVTVAREALSLRRPATRFGAVAWECEPGNKIYALQLMRPARVRDVVSEVAERTRCHTPDEAGKKKTT